MTTATPTPTPTSTTATASPIIIRVGVNWTPIKIASRTPRAIVAAARQAVNLLSIEDIRAISTWSTYEVEAVWDGGYTDDSKHRGNLSIVGVLAMWIGCNLLDVEFSTGLDDAKDQDFMDRLWAIAPRVP